MARNKGFILSGPAEINTQRKQLKEIIDSLLPACTEPDLDSGMPFRAQAIIANPPAYGEIDINPFADIWTFLIIYVFQPSIIFINPKGISVSLSAIKEFLDNIFWLLSLMSPVSHFIMDFSLWITFYKKKISAFFLLVEFVSAKNQMPF